MHAVVQGEADQTVVFDSGLGSCSLDWSHIQSELSKHAATVAYDRAGYGWSYKNRGSATSKEIVEDLRDLLKQLNLEPSYILVGHSFGGLNMRLFAQLYPKEVSGLILVDSTNEYQFLPEYIDERWRREYTRYLKSYRLGYLFSIPGITRFINRPVWNRSLPLTFKPLGFRRNAYEALYKKYMSIIVSCRMVKDQGINKDIPITVLTAGKMNESWKEGQQKLTKLSPNTRQIIAQDSYHNIHFEHPEIVVKAVMEILNFEARGD
nr:alpha/beta hydrolase [Paenibacillus pinistramenti]